MTVHVISYDLNKQKDYAKLYEAIKGLSGTWCRPVDSTWYVRVELTAAQVRDHLVRFIDSDDVLIVSQAGATAWSASLPATVAQWLKANL